jgi:hypothetical protein
MKKSYLFLIILVLFIIPIEIAAAFSATSVIEFKNPLKATTTEEIIDAITNLILALAMVLVPLMVIVGGFYFITSAGEAAKVEKAKKIFVYALIGFLVALFAKAFIAIIKNLFGG